ncbi:TetR/AcrR family transcriptional regulator [Nocardioides sp. Leaf285]|uniref:TetR/AcrR family transcriptional regulator n=1 Tax=Nocardioides sp. Leaf285 TaxID=1736322 RepID=UPI0007032754|nr:TetR/AcrR family transcriptional regulator [Nocardioides sp. Leaf285]KQP63623.1 TetR family transcriptional regulator [Nocardioides sp. Leaf285]
MAVKAGRYRGMSAQERAATRRAQLLAATLDVWGADGGPRVTMTRICAEAGLTERYFYEHFASLDEALTAAMQQVGDEITVAALAAIEETEGGPTERIRAAIGAFVAIITDDPRKGRVTMLEAPGRPELRPARNALLRAFAELATREGRALYGDDAWAGQPGDLAGLMFVGGVQELVTAWLDGTLDVTPDDIVEAATRAFAATARGAQD